MMKQLLSEYVKRITEKALAGKKLSDWEIGILMMDQLRSSLEARINETKESLEAEISRTKESLEAKMDENRIELETKIESNRKDLEGKNGDR
jgi:hypothetical protein